MKMLEFKFFETILYPEGYLRGNVEKSYYGDGWLAAERGWNTETATHFTYRIRKVWLAGYYNYLTYKEFGTIPRGI